MNNLLTTTLPSEPGYFWLQIKDVTQIVKIVQRKSNLFIEYGQFFIPLAHYTRVGALWAGPIPAPNSVTAEVKPKESETVLLRDKDLLERFAEVKNGCVTFVSRHGMCFVDKQRTTLSGIRILEQL